MKAELTTQKPNLTPASFDNGLVRLTDAQKELMKLLHNSVSSGEMISREMMLDFYIKHIKKSETYKEFYNDYYGEYEGKWGHYRETYAVPKIKKWRDEYSIKLQSYQWFKMNLGAVIIKGKVLIVPVFED